MTGLQDVRQRGCITVALVAAICPVLLAPAAEAATCGPSEGTIAAADVAFVGTLAGPQDSPQATFAVEEVWKGGNLAAVVQVAGVPGQWSDSSAAGRYLVLATVVGSSLQVGSECNLAYLWDASMAAWRPAAAHAPTGAETEAGMPVELVVIVSIAALILIVSGLAFRRPRAPA